MCYWIETYITNIVLLILSIFDWKGRYSISIILMQLFRFEKTKRDK